MRIRFFNAWRSRLPVDLHSVHVLPSSEFWARCSEAWFAIERRRSVPIQKSNIAAARLTYWNDVFDNVFRTKGDVWNAVVDCRKGSGGKTNMSGRATPALVDKDGKDGNRIETENGIRLRWVEHFASIEAGSVVFAEHIVDTVMAADN